MHEWLFAGALDEITARRKSLFSSTLVLPGLDIYEALKIDDPNKLEWKERSINLRGATSNSRYSMGPTSARLI